MKIIKLIPVPIFAIALTLAYFFFTDVSETVPEIKARAPREFSVIGVGDIMMGTNYPNESFLPPNGGRDLFKPVEHILKSATVTFGNLEGPLLDSGGRSKCAGMESNLCYAFRTPVSYVEHLVNAGFDLINLANNHVYDFGEVGVQSTVRALNSKNLAHAGLLSQPTVIIERDGVKFGLAAFAPNWGVVSLLDHENAKKIVSQLKEECDIVIVSFHGGAEGPTESNPNVQMVPRATEFFFGENRGNVYTFSRAVIDAGADIVFGHGPHVTRSIDLYKGRIIAYSLGNFCTYGRFNLRGQNGIGPILKVYVNKDGEFLRGEIIATRQIKRGEPIIDENKTVIKTMQQLLRANFPEAPLNIDDNGLVTIKR